MATDAANPNIIPPGHTTTLLPKARPRSTRHRKVATRIILLSLMIFAFAISVFTLSGQSLRLDEAQSLWQSSHSPLGMLYVIGQDVHVPLYPLLLYFWQLFFGSDVYLDRLLSLLFFLASIPLTYAVGRLAYNRRVGLFAALLVAVSPFLNWYGNEIRMYSLLMLLTLVNQYFFIKLFKDKTRLSKDQETKYWWGYGLSALLGIYTHYFFWFILAIQAVFYLFYNHKFPAKSLGKFVLIALLLLAAIAPWLYYVQRIGLIANAEPILNKPTSVNFFNTFSQFVFGFQDDHVNTLIVSLWPLSVLLVFLSLRKNQKIPVESVYFFLSAIFPIVLAFIVSVAIVPLFLTRYLILTVPSLFLFFSWFLTSYSKKLAFGLKTILVVLMLLTLANQIRSADTPVKENYQQASQYLEQQATAQDIVAISAPFTIYPIEYYYKGPASLVTLPIWDRFKFGPIPTFSKDQLPAQVDQIKGSHQRLFLVLSYNQGYESEIKDYFDNHFERVGEKNFSSDLNIYIYKLRYDTVSTNTIIKDAQNFHPGG